ncbi:hypothetical protein Back11_43710 [Paenibacillus baekrokdamisoli]|uniref:Uncharacterized protein n=1 Tax=Paenibacillus baekrokdamisoli TaxID=1712516 RepID=A0A3G9IWX6_9BACL|nr:hypothetical protein [Paenibacillus baekrokdamisoli]MBB3067927.1 hypothetical protein [Paenibacillus baekrokdamisoli]BBH23026.1 hypothetical protein Back11_43710 [Paenibacillus baekrokdamisoli]
MIVYKDHLAFIMKQKMEASKKPHPHADVVLHGGGELGLTVEPYSIRHVVFMFTSFH